MLWQCKVTPHRAACIAVYYSCIGLAGTGCCFLQIIKRVQFCVFVCVCDLSALWTGCKVYDMYFGSSPWCVSYIVCIACEQIYCSMWECMWHALNPPINAYVCVSSCQSFDSLYRWFKVDPAFIDHMQSPLWDMLACVCVWVCVPTVIKWVCWQCSAQVISFINLVSLSASAESVLSVIGTQLRRLSPSSLTHSLPLSPVSLSLHPPHLSPSSVSSFNHFLVLSFPLFTFRLFSSVTSLYQF